MTPEELLRFCGENSLLIKALALAVAIAGIIALHFAIAYGSVHIRLPWHRRLARQRAKEIAVLKTHGGSLDAEIVRQHEEIARLTERALRLEAMISKQEAEVTRVDAIRRRTDEKCIELKARVAYLESLVAEVPLGK